MPPYEPIHYDASSIKTFSVCAFQHYYKKFVPKSYKKEIEKEDNTKTGGALPSHVGNLFHSVVDIIHNKYIDMFPNPTWDDVESTLELEWGRYRQAHIENCLRKKAKGEKGEVTLKDEHKTVTLTLLKHYYEVFWLYPQEKVVVSELNCRWSDIGLRRKLSNLPRGNRYAQQKFYGQYGVLFDKVMVTLVGVVDYVYKSPDHRRIGVCDFKTVYSSNRKEVERQFISQIEATRFQLGVYATLLPHWLDPNVMLEGVLSEASVRLISPLGVQQRTFNKDEVQHAKEQVRRNISHLIQLRKKHVLKPEMWTQTKNFACDGCKAFGVCKTANPEADVLIPSPDWDIPNQEALQNASVDFTYHQISLLDGNFL